MLKGVYVLSKPFDLTMTSSVRRRYPISFFKISLSLIDVSYQSKLGEHNPCWKGVIVVYQSHVSLQLLRCSYFKWCLFVIILFKFGDHSPSYRKLNFLEVTWSVCDNITSTCLISLKLSQIPLDVTQLTFHCSKSTIETLEKGAKYVQS